ncbi:MAG: type III-B CRISPR module-associated protein Cmr5 [Rikenellaceae bacterium]
MIDKKKISALIPIANSSVSSIIENNEIPSTYNGKVAALSVSIAMSGLLPTLAMYRRSSTSDELSETQKILGIISNMINFEGSPYLNCFENIADNDGTLMNNYAIRINSNEIRDAIIHCAIALKLVIRTYKLNND